MLAFYHLYKKEPRPSVGASPSFLLRTSERDAELGAWPIATAVPRIAIGGPHRRIRPVLVSALVPLLVSVPLVVPLKLPLVLPVIPVQLALVLVLTIVPRLPIPIVPTIPWLRTLSVVTTVLGPAVVAAGLVLVPTLVAVRHRRRRVIRVTRRPNAFHLPWVVVPGLIVVPRVVLGGGRQCKKHTGDESKKNEKETKAFHDAPPGAFVFKLHHNLIIITSQVLLLPRLLHSLIVSYIKNRLRDEFLSRVGARATYRSRGGGGGQTSARPPMWRTHRPSGWWWHRLSEPVP